MKELNLKLIINCLALAFFSGCAAEYQTIRNSQGGQQQNRGSQDSERQEGPVIASVEVVWQDQIVLTVPVATTFVIRPGKDTGDKDNLEEGDFGTAECPNPGIVNFKYEVDRAPVGEVARTGDPCLDPSITHQIDIIGTYDVTLIATSDEQEVGTATITIEVVAADDPGLEPKVDVGVGQDGDNPRDPNQNADGNADGNGDDDQETTGGGQDSSSTTGGNDDGNSTGGSSTGNSTGGQDGGQSTGGSTDGTTSTSGDDGSYDDNDDDDGDTTGGGGDDQDPSQTPGQSPSQTN